MKYSIYAGLSGGFGGARFIDTFECDLEDDAVEYAYEEACRIYESYDGFHGLRSHSQIMEEESCDEDTANAIWGEEREGWIDYWVKPFEQGDDK